MTDTRALEERISELGLKYSFVAEKCGITYAGLRKKMDNESEFKASEIDALAELLQLNLAQVHAIFFKRV